MFSNLYKKIKKEVLGKNNGLVSTPLISATKAREGAYISFYFCLHYFILPDDEKALGWHIRMKFQSYSDGNEQ